MKQQEPLFTKNYILLIVTAFIGGFLMTLFTSTLPLYAQRLTGSPVYAGLVTTLFTIAALAARPVTGVICEKKRHVPILIIGFAFMTCACLLFNWVNAIALFLAIRMLHGVGFGIKTTVSGVLVADHIPQERFAEGIGIYNLYLPLTNALGPALAYYIIGDGDVGNFKTLFIIGAVMGGLAIVLCFFLKDRAGQPVEKSMEQDKVSKDLPPSFLGFEKGVVTPSIVLMLMYVGQGAILSFIALYSMDTGIGDVGAFFVVNAAALFFARFFYAKGVKKTGYDMPTQAGLLIFAVGLILIPLAKNLFMLYVAAVFLGIAMGIVPMAINAITLERCSKQRSGTAMAAYTSAMDIGVGLGSMILGFILSHSSYLCIFMIAGLCSVGATMIYYFTLRGDKKILLRK